MARKRWVVEGALLGLLLLAMAGRADEAEAMKAVKKLGGEVEVDNKRPGSPVVGIHFHNSNAKMTDKAMAEFKPFKSLEWLDLTGCLQVTDAGLKELKELKNLQELSLGGRREIR